MSVLSGFSYFPPLYYLSFILSVSIISVSKYPFLNIRFKISVSKYPFQNIRFWISVSGYPFLDIRFKNLFLNIHFKISVSILHVFIFPTL